MTNASNTDMNAIVAFNKAQAEMGRAIKNQKNTFLKNSYADLGAIQDAVLPAFQANGFAILQVGGHDEFGPYMATEAHHTSGAVFSSRIYLEHKKGDMQSLGSAITYARRYGLSAISGVPVEDDDGNHAVGHDRVQAKVKKPQPSIHQRADKLEAFLTSKPDADAFIKAGPNAHSLLELLTAQDRPRAEKLNQLWLEHEERILKD